MYDQMLDAGVMVGAIPSRYGWDGGDVPLSTYFAMARGDAKNGIAAMEMTKWFDTNYHYLVPELHRQQTFRLASNKPVAEFLEAKQLGIHTRPVLIGPVTYLLLGKSHGGDFDRLSLLDALLPVYEEILGKLAEAGADWIQLDEPCLVMDIDDQVRAALHRAYQRLSRVSPKLSLLVATYCGALQDNLKTAVELPVQALHVDVVRGQSQLTEVLEAVPKDKMLSLGLIDGRNIWRADLVKAAGLLRQAVAVLGEDRVIVGPSCSLLHVPVDLEAESSLLSLIHI